MLHSVQVQAILMLLMLFILKNLVFCKEIKKEEKKNTPDKKRVVNLQKQSVLKQ
jgi:hypothetical protein